MASIQFFRVPGYPWGKNKTFTCTLHLISTMPYSLCPVLFDHESDASPALSGLVSNISFDDAPRLNLVILYTEATLLVHFCFL